MVPPPSAAVRVASVQVVEALAGSATSTSPGTVGRTSVNARPVTGVAVLLVRVNVAVLTLPGPMTLGVKTLENAKLGT